MTAPVFGPYSTIAPLLGKVRPSWVPEEDQDRIASYQKYEELYWNTPDAWVEVTRGSDTLPLYVPTARTIVETTNRYVGVGLGFAITPGIGTPDQIAAAQLFYTNLFRRENFYAQYNSNKRYGIMRGDSVFHVTADSTKPEGLRISIEAIDPGSYFPVFESDIVEGGDPNKLVKVHLADQIELDGKVYVRRQTYEYEENGRILSSEAVFDVKDWQLSTSPFRVITAPTELDARIPAIPVYHIRNFDEPQNPFGSSELRGVERALSGINQAFTDEDIALGLEGLGLYYTSAGRPVDPETGQPTAWILGPGRVIENVPDFNRVQGVGSVQPYTDHIQGIYSFVKEGLGLSDAAIGKVDVTIAESGIALAMQLGPTLAKAAEKDEEIKGKLTHLLYDLKFWAQVFEGQSFIEVEVLPTFGPKVPTNVQQLIKDVTALTSTVPPMMSMQTGREILARAGVAFAPDEDQRIATEADSFAQRSSTELGGAGA